MTGKYAYGMALGTTVRYAVKNISHNVQNLTIVRTGRSYTNRFH